MISRRLFPAMTPARWAAVAALVVLVAAFPLVYNNQYILTVIVTAFADVSGARQVAISLPPGGLDGTKFLAQSLEEGNRLLALRLGGFVGRARFLFLRLRILRAQISRTLGAAGRRNLRHHEAGQTIASLGANRSMRAVLQGRTEQRLNRGRPRVLHILQDRAQPLVLDMVLGEQLQGLGGRLPERLGRGQENAAVTLPAALERPEQGIDDERLLGVVLRQLQDAPLVPVPPRDPLLAGVELLHQRPELLLRRRRLVRRVRALAAYKEFLALWKDADADIPILKEAKVELEKLQ